MTHAFHAAALVAAARTAFGTARRIDDRRAGRDASGQEPAADARADLAALAEAVAGHVARLRLRVIVGAPDAEPAAFVQSFEDRLLLADLGDALALAHQKLLSLYPAVGESLVESTRQLATRAARQSVADAPNLAALADAAADVVDGLREVA